jgi:4-azaleucine resistance transporter AzlC
MGYCMTTKSPSAEAQQELIQAHNIACSRPGFQRGLRASITIAAGPIIWGVSMGVIASEAGFSSMGAVLMSLLVYSGSAQTIAVDMMQRDAGLVAILVSTFLVSLRYILMGFTMSGWFRSTPRWLFWPGIHYLSDQSWAMTITEMRDGRRDVGFFFGINVGMLLGWTVGTAIGVTIGDVAGNSLSGLYFASTAALVGILAEMKLRLTDLLPWGTAAVAATVSQQLLGGSWYMFIGVAAGLIAALATGGDDA